MPAGISQFKMDPRRLSASVKSAFPISVKVANADASARLHNKSKSSVKSRVTSDTTATLYGTGLATVFETGREGGYEINPGGVTGIRRTRRKGVVSYGVKGGTGDTFTLKFPGPKGNNVGGFSKVGVLGGPMKSYPAMGPAGRDWANGGYQKVATAKLAASGFGKKF